MVQLQALFKNDFIVKDRADCSSYGVGMRLQESVYMNSTGRLGRHSRKPLGSVCPPSVPPQAPVATSAAGALPRKPWQDMEPCD